MASRNGKSNDPPGLDPMSITVGGFKSIAREQTVEIRPLTILAGANSSGKSSLMQAVLLLKQTLEASYDPGAILINGPNVRFTKVNQLLSRCKKGISTFIIGIRYGADGAVRFEYHRGKDRRLEVLSTSYGHPVLRIIKNEMTKSELVEIYASSFNGMSDALNKAVITSRIERDRCFLQPILELKTSNESTIGLPFRPEHEIEFLIREIKNIMHLPGLRGNPERVYKYVSTGPEYPGTFENYTASIIREWSEKGDERISQLSDDLFWLGLTWKVTAANVDDAHVEIRVGRLLRSQQGGGKDLVNIADVGVGVSQTLPVLVGLLAAKPNQLLYIEQPEIHLHPRAQVAMGKLLANAANRGVRVIIETHSSLLLLGVQSQIADGHLDPKRVKLHWFNRSETDGSTEIVSADVDAEGRFPGWPEDFDDVSLEAQQHYMDAVEKRQVAG